MNTVILMGRVGADPEFKAFDSDGGGVTNFSLATNKKFKTKSGEKKEITHWHKIKAFGKLAKIIEQYVEKGSLISILGEIEYRSYDKDGVVTYITEINAKEMTMISSPNQGNDRPKGNEPANRSEPDDDLPF